MESQQSNSEMFNKYNAVRQQNNDVLKRIAAFLDTCPTMITADLMHQMNPDGQLEPAQAYAYLLATICDLDVVNSEYDYKLMADYFLPAVQQMSVEQFVDNPYYRNLHFPEVHSEDWEFRWVKYQPYEAFLCDDIALLPDYREIPAVGSFDREVAYPMVLQNEQEWMAVKPSEIATMQTALNKVSGEVFTFGLGLGYFTYMASQKPEVSSITVVEQDAQVINLFNQYLLSQFPEKQKVKIIQTDAVDFLQHDFYKCKCDYLFVDLWHDVSDGLSMYLKVKAQEKQFPNVKFLYWIEKSLQSALRWQLAEHTSSMTNQDNQ